MTKMLALALPLVGCALLMFGPGNPALAAGGAGPGCGGTSCTLYVVSGPEVNEFRVDVDSAGRIVISDQRPGAQLVKSYEDFGACAEVNAATISCNPAALGVMPPYALSPLLGPGDSFDPGTPGCDSGPFALVAASVEAEGGAGATLIGTTAADEINIFGHATVESCAGNDGLTVSGARGQQATISLGPGKDDVEGHGALLAVVNGDEGNDAIDTPRGIIHGGPGNDVLYDGRGRSQVFGEEGNDFLGSGPGKDLLGGGTGNDTLEAGQRRRGNPIRVRVLPGAPDRLRCGPGRDRATAGRNSRLRGCERVRRLPEVVTQA